MTPRHRPEVNLAIRVGFVIITISVGGFMIIDGARNVLTGTYFGPSLGPWSGLVKAAGLDPHHFGGVFLALGVAWFVALLGLLTRMPWGLPGGLTVGILTLWYLPVGTVLSVVYIAVLISARRTLASPAGGRGRDR